MSKKYHINPKTGVPTICRAKQGQCPYEDAFGGDNHNDTFSEAQEASYNIMRDEFGLVYDLMEEFDRRTLSVVLRDYEELESAIGEEFKGDDRELDAIMSDLINTDDEERIMRVINGIDYPDMDWEKLGAVLQNPYLPEDFMADLFDYTDNYHTETIRLFMWNNTITEERLFEFASSEDDDMVARCIAMMNDGVSEETADKLMKTQREIFSELPWHFMLENPSLRDLESFKEYKETEAYKNNEKMREEMNKEIQNYPEWWEYYGNY